MIIEWSLDDHWMILNDTEWYCMAYWKVRRSSGSTLGCSPADFPSWNRPDEWWHAAVRPTSQSFKFDSCAPFHLPLATALKPWTKWQDWRIIPWVCSNVWVFATQDTSWKGHEQFHSRCRSTIAPTKTGRTTGWLIVIETWACVGYSDTAVCLKMGYTPK